MELTDAVIGILFTILGGILKHIYGKFADLDKTDKEQDSTIANMKSEINILASHNQQRQKDVEDIKRDVKDVNEKVTKIMIKLGA